MLRQKLEAHIAAQADDDGDEAPGGAPPPKRRPRWGGRSIALFAARPALRTPTKESGVPTTSICSKHQESPYASITTPAESPQPTRVSSPAISGSAGSTRSPASSSSSRTSNTTQAAFETLLDEQRLARALQENDAQLHELYEESNIKSRRGILTTLGYQNPTCRTPIEASCQVNAREDRVSKKCVWV